MVETQSKMRVLLGMSGGTDSSVAAILLQDKGYEVIGVTFLFSAYKEQNELHIKDAKQVAKELGIEHYTVDLRKEFSDKIIQRFIREYKEGKTPFPCAFCNPQLKFKHLNNLALKFNCNYISTGHYVQITDYNNQKFISKGKDKEKDQSFFLWGLRNEIINKLIFPLGNFEKSEIRELAKKRGFNKISNKKDSLGICFVNEFNYRKYLINKGIESKQGNFIDRQGNVVGTHEGIINYTVGQRRGLGLNLNKPVFVSEIKAEENQIVVADFADLYKTRIYIENIRFVDFETLDQDKTYTVKIRYRLQNNKCKLRIIDEMHAEIQLIEPVAMVANGQTAVIYEEDRVLGGGFIEGSE